MEDKNLSQRVKELRKNKGLSQEELAKTAGLSLRTIQRVENKETEPTGDTLKRIATALNSTPAELINWTEDTLKKTIKTKNEYLHIFEDKLVISKGPEIKDLLEDFGKNVNNIFKSLLVFLVYIPLFTVLSFILYNRGIIGSAMFSGSFAFFFLVFAIRTILFTFGSSLIKVKNIQKIKIKRTLFQNVLLISHKDSGRVKERALVLTKKQVENMRDSLVAEKLIKEEDIELKRTIISFQTFSLALVFIIFLYSLVSKKRMYDIHAFYGIIMLITSFIIVIEMIYKLIAPSFNKTTKSVSDERV